MSDFNNDHRDNLNEEELWEKKFEEDLTDSTSRSERRAMNQKDGKSSNLLAVAILIMAILIILPLLYITWQNRVNREEFRANQESIAVVQEDDEQKETEESDTDDDDTAEDEKESESESDQAEAERKAAEERERAETERKRQEEQARREAQERAAEEARQREAAEQNQNTNEIPEGVKTHVVQPKDNLYRIALNNGMTTEELMELNGLKDTTIQVGQVLRLE